MESYVESASFSGILKHLEFVLVRLYFFNSEAILYLLILEVFNSHSSLENITVSIRIFYYIS